MVLDTRCKLRAIRQGQRCRENGNDCHDGEDGNDDDVDRFSDERVFSLGRGAQAIPCNYLSSF